VTAPTSRSTSSTEGGSPPPDLLEVGHIARAHGLRGEVVVALSTNRDERVARGAVLWAGPVPLTVVTSTPHLGRWVVAFEGVHDRPAADALRGAVLAAPALEDPDVLWVHQIVGSHLIDQDGTDRGVVVSVQVNPASDLMVLDNDGLVPLRFVTSAEPGVVRADLPEGLLD